MFTDTHNHIYEECFGDIDCVLERAVLNHVDRYFVNGSDHESNIKVLELASCYPGVYACLGIHPESVTIYQERDLDFIETHLSSEKVIAVGEIGLDYYYTKENIKEQQELFRKQLLLAEKYHKPVIIHSREATLDTINILKEYSVRGVIHSFTGSYETAMIYIKMGFLLGINGVLTFKNSHLKEVIEKLPKEAIVLETDAPFLTPEPYRGKQNEPSYVFVIAEFLSSLWGISIDELAVITNANIQRIFDI